MSNLQTVIKQVSNWETLTASQLFDSLQQKTIHYLDKKEYRLDDIAKLIGDENMNAFLDAVRAAGYDWMITQAANGFYPYEDPINTRLRLLNNPHATLLANHTNRMVSLFEQYNLTATLEEISKVQAELKLKIYVQQKIDMRTDQLQNYTERMYVWDGTGKEPEF